MTTLPQRVALGLTALAGAFATSAFGDNQAVFEANRAQFVERMVADHGFDRDELAAVLATATLNDDVLEAISRPVERVVPWFEYRKIFLNEQRIDAGVAFWRDRAAAIERAAERYDVAPEIIVAIVGVETFFGRRMGSYRVLDSLATLAFAYPPRARFFAGELEELLLLAREEGPHVLDAKSSYAGAMGAGQFIPSSYRAYAVDGDGDGRRDLWTDWDDALASVANYFHAHGWKPGEPVVDRATRPADWSGPEPDGNGLELDSTVGDLAALGYEFDSSLPATAPATLIALEGEGDTREYWVGYHNYRVITRYNRSAKYALAAHQLGQAIREAYEAAQQGAVAQ
ncbi:MAG TPA: lytic murein transglycosylase B [Gammaproteobacteria bacterium]